MKKILPAFILYILLSSGCINKKNDVDEASYLEHVHDSLVEISSNLDSYSTSRALYNNGSVDVIEAYDTANMAYTINQRIVDNLNKTKPPTKFNRFHSLIVSSSERFSSAYRFDADCIKTGLNVSCEKARDEIISARDTHKEALKELSGLGVRVY